MIRTAYPNLILVADDRPQNGMHMCKKLRSKAANRVYDDWMRRVPDEDACGDEAESQ